jgi:hypothetical protein
MKNNKLSLFSTLLFGFFVLQSCDPERFCEEPKCMYSDVNTEIHSTLSGKLDSIIHIGDTIRFYMKIPDTIVTNYGNLAFGTLLTNSFFGFNIQSFDSIGIDLNLYGNKKINPVLVKNGEMPNGTITWNYATREFECLIIPSTLGKYIFNVTTGRIEMKAIDNKSWLINPIITTNITNQHHDFYVSWFPPSYQNQANNEVRNLRFRYCFEVK